MTTPRTLQLRMIIGILALVGLFMALYLALYEVKLSESMVCPLGGECEKVNSSPYVWMFGIPIGGLGVIGYGLILGVDVGWMTRRRLAGGTSPRPPAWAGRVPWAYNVLSRIPVGLVLIGMSGFGFLFSLFLTYLELSVIAAKCTWCMFSAGLMTVIFALTLWAWFAEREVSP